MASQIITLKISQLSNFCSDSCYHRLVIMMDRTVASHFSELTQSLQSLPKVQNIFYLQGAENLKSLDMYAYWSEKLLATSLDRSTHMVAIGGGTITDFCGFLAATLLRGLSWTAIPTTYLGMIDGAIGGKVALNSGVGKNMIGTFHEPDNILICQHFLSTFDQQQLKRGLGELVKYALLSEQIYQEIMTGKQVIELILMCAQYKQSVVAQDLKDSKGLRMCLNLGHTLGHSFEKACQISHSEAVLCGLVLEGYMCENLIDNHQSLKALEIITTLHLNVVLQEALQKIIDMWQPNNMINFCYHDKKGDQGLITIVITDKTHKVHNLQLSPGDFKDKLSYLQGIINTLISSFSIKH
ncbi:MAG: 3-dehydroquinate synthase [Proteobacteria bacterium]|nr:3-dehydroquinate synthase [Pseudomonadota bacterium]